MTDNPLRALVKKLPSLATLDAVDDDAMSGRRPCPLDNFTIQDVRNLHAALAAPAQDAVAWISRKGNHRGSLVWRDYGLSLDLPDGTYLYAGTPPTPSGNAALVAALYNAAANGFHVSQTCGPDETYQHISKFKTITDLQAFASAWIALMVSQRDALAGQAQATQSQPECNHAWVTDNFGPTACSRCGEKATQPQAKEAGRDGAKPYAGSPVDDLRENLALLAHLAAKADPEAALHFVTKIKDALAADSQARAAELDAKQRPADEEALEYDGVSANANERISITWGELVELRRSVRQPADGGQREGEIARETEIESLGNAFRELWMERQIFGTHPEAEAFCDAVTARSKEMQLARNGLSIVNNAAQQPTAANVPSGERIPVPLPGVGVVFMDGPSGLPELPEPMVYDLGTGLELFDVHQMQAFYRKGREDAIAALGGRKGS